MKLCKKQCASCPFLHEGMLSPATMAEIQNYLISGTNHLCHNDRTNDTVCQGGRKFQLKVWHRMGIICEPTNEALANAMRDTGVEPKKHICG